MTEILGGLAVTLIICIFPSYNYFSDGLVDAYDIETSAIWIVHPHHPLVPLIPQAIFRAMGGLGSGITGLGLLHVWSILFGIIGCWGMIFLLRAARFSTATTLSGLALYAFSNGVWYFNTVPNQNSTALAMHILALLAIVYPAMQEGKQLSSKNAILIGLLTSFAILCSQLNTVLILPAIYLFLFNKPATGRGKALFAYAATVVVVTGGLFLFLVAGLKNIGSFSELTAWQRSYILSPRYWASGIGDSLIRSLRGAASLHLAYLWQPGSLFNPRNGHTGSLPIMLGQALVLSFFIIETIRAFISWVITRPGSTVQNLALITGLPIFLFSFVFTPEWVNYRILYMPSLILFISPVIESDFGLKSPSLRKLWPLLIVILSLFLTNFTLKYLPESNARHNLYLNEARELSKNYGLHDRIIYLSAYDGDYRIKYTRYFTQCNVTRVIDLVAAIRRNPAEVEAFFRDGFRDGGRVLVHEDALHSPEGVEWVNERYGTDIKPDEVASFFNKHFRVVDKFAINGSRYYVMQPLGGYAGT